MFDQDNEEGFQNSEPMEHKEKGPTVEPGIPQQRRQHETRNAEHQTECYELVPIPEETKGDHENLIAPQLTTENDDQVIDKASMCPRHRCIIVFIVSIVLGAVAIGIGIGICIGIGIGTGIVSKSDIKDPVLASCPANQTSNTDPGQPTAIIVWQGPIATDNSCLNPTVMCDPASGTDFVIGITKVTYTALDGFGNADTCSFYIDVKDNEDPVLESCLANQTTNTDPGQPTAMVLWQGPIATDNSGLNPTVTCDPASGTDFAIGITNVTCTALDGFGNVNNCSFYVDVKDNEDPVLESCPANQTTNTDPGQPTTMVLWQGPIATDNAGLNPTVMCDPASGTDFVIGITKVTCTALDGFGNANNCSFNINVKDNEGPVLASCPANQITNTDPGQPTAMIVWQGPIATDNSGLKPTVICDPSSGTDFVIGITNVTCTALDGFGNVNDCSFYVDVMDNEDPVFESCLPDQIDYGQPTAIVIWQDPVATDNSGSSPTVICDPQSGTSLPIGQALVSCTAFDGYGNNDSCSFNVFIHDIRDCFDLVSNGDYPSGIYTITPSDGLSFQVYCDMSTENAGWTVFQRRLDGTVNFYRNWTDYENGFGNVGGEYWAGLRLLPLLTSGNPSILRVELEAFDGDKAYAEYPSFSVGDSSSNYVLTIGSYSGNAGDSLRHHNNKAFSTYDRDQDRRSGNCAQERQGAWWYGNCAYSNLNGQYLGPTGTNNFAGMTWYHWKSRYEPLKTSEMKVRRVQ
ncbi:uncharacterized protein [Amphiura filiformis]|uniref:uncharacterized protein n=1 Tax=Amphiura filiformis TaxID=82378 RepID=UPI003B20F5D6